MNSPIKILLALNSALVLAQKVEASHFRSPAMAIGAATSMERVMPKERFSARSIPSEGLRVRLARNECESVQVVVSPRNTDLKGVKVCVAGDLRGEGGVFAATNITCCAMGYVNVTNDVPYLIGRSEPSDTSPGYVRQTCRPKKGWWPDPILDFLDSVDVSGSDVQSFWVRVRCPALQTVGVYRGALVVSAAGVAAVRIPFSVRVNDFAIGRASPLSMAITFCPEAMNVETSPSRLWRKHKIEWADFLADYFITMDDLYNGGGREIPFDLLERLKSQGRLGVFNIGYWTYPKSTNAADVATWRAKTVPRLRKVYDEVKARGLLAHAYCYGCDEAKPETYPQVRLAARELKAALPDVPLVSAFCCEYDVGATLDEVDWLVPQTWQFRRGKAEESRKAGHRVWWYICCGPQAPYANMFLECPVIEGRILMGAQTVRMRPDGFLYFQLTLWRRCARCIETGPFTDWSPKSTFGCTYNGDGSWVCAGPDGIPLPTIRLENFRDGLEDYAYAKILEVLLAKRSDKGDKWSRKAKELLAVPDTVLDVRDVPQTELKPGDWKGCKIMYSMTNYTDNPAAVYRWRDAMADLIEESNQCSQTQ